MNEMFAKARQNVKDIPDLQMIEEDAVSSYHKKRQEIKSYRSPKANNNHNEIQQMRSRSEFNNKDNTNSNRGLIEKSNSKFMNMGNINQPSRSRSQMLPQYATGYNAYTGQYYQYIVNNTHNNSSSNTHNNNTNNTQQQLQNDSTSSRHRTKAEKEAKLDAKILKLQNKLSSTSYTKMMSAAPPNISSNPTYNMNYYSGTQPPLFYQ